MTDCPFCLDTPQNAVGMTCSHLICEACAKLCVSYDKGKWQLQCGECRKVTTLERDAAGEEEAMERQKTENAEKNLQDLARKLGLRPIPRTADGLRMKIVGHWWNGLPVPNRGSARAPFKLPPNVGANKLLDELSKTQRPLDDATPTEETPAEETPAEETPAEETPTEATPTVPPPAEEAPEPRSPVSSRHVVILDLPSAHEASWDHVVGLVSACGVIENMRLLSRGLHQVAFVHFRDVESGPEAHRRLNGATWLGATLKVQDTDVGAEEAKRLSVYNLRVPEEGEVLDAFKAKIKKRFAPFGAIKQVLLFEKNGDSWASVEFEQLKDAVDACRAAEAANRGAVVHPTTDDDDDEEAFPLLDGYHLCVRYNARPRRQGENTAITCSEYANFQAAEARVIQRENAIETRATHLWLSVAFDVANEERSQGVTLGPMIDSLDDLPEGNENIAEFFRSKAREQIEREEADAEAQAAARAQAQADERRRTSERAEARRRGRDDFSDDDESRRGRPRRRASRNEERRHQSSRRSTRAESPRRRRDRTRSRSRDSYGDSDGRRPRRTQDRGRHDRRRSPPSSSPPRRRRRRRDSRSPSYSPYTDDRRSPSYGTESRRPLKKSRRSELASTRNSPAPRQRTSPRRDPASRRATPPVRESPLSEAPPQASDVDIPAPPQASEPPPRAQASEVPPPQGSDDDEVPPSTQVFTEESPLPQAFSNEESPLPQAFSSEVPPPPQVFTEESPLPKAFSDDEVPPPTQVFTEESPPPPLGLALASDEVPPPPAPREAPQHRGNFDHLPPRLRAIHDAL